MKPELDEIVGNLDGEQDDVELLEVEWMSVEELAKVKV